MIAGLLDHLWQSTLFAGAAGLLTWTLRHNQARLRHGLWLAASLKFLVPFSLLIAAGAALAPAMPVLPDLRVLQQSAQPFAMSAPVFAAPVSGHSNPFLLLFAVWLAGFSAVVLVWLRRWRQIRAVLRGAVPLNLPAPIPVKCTHSAMGPGLFGIVRPVLLLPHGIAARLDPGEMRAILDHELCHLERHDNLTAAIHMVVEALFWFHPLVWWLGARLIAEREQACDENVVACGNEAGTYAESILKVCRYYTGPPPPLAAAVLSARLEERLEAIMGARTIRELGLAQKTLLNGALVLAIAWPLLGGWSGAVRDKIARAVAPLAHNEAGLHGDIEMAKFNGAQPLADGGVWHEDTTSQADCESHFRAVLQQLERGYGKFAPLYPQRAKNDRDALPISLRWKNGLGDSRYQEATVYMSDETAHVWDARRHLDGRYIDAAALWSAQSETTRSVCLTEISVKA